MSKRTRYALYILSVIAKFICDDAELKKEIDGLSIRYNSELIDEEAK